MLEHTLSGKSESHHHVPQMDFFLYRKRAIMKMFIQPEFEKKNLLIQGRSGTKFCCRSPFIIIF